VNARSEGTSVVSQAPSAIVYDDVGADPVVVLLHGFAGTAHTHFGPLIEALASSYRVIAPDLRGYGRSAHLERVADAEMFQRDAADLLDLLDRLDIPAAHVIGFSDGGETAIILASQLGARALSLTVWGVSGHIPPPAVVDLYAEPEARMPNWPHLREQLERLHGAGTASGMMRSWAGAMRAIASQGGDINLPEAASLTCPALVIAGDHDPFNPLEATRALVARMPTARLVVLPGAGHDLLEERGPQLLALVQRMLGSAHA
jgi:valacyclovir hydrolase